MDEETDTGSSVLVVYYSATGSTERAASYIADALDTDILELEPVDPYTDEELDYTNRNSRTSLFRAMILQARRLFRSAPPAVPALAKAENFWRRWPGVEHGWKDRDFPAVRPKIQSGNGRLVLDSLSKKKSI